ncbi:MAG: (Fe-S)-binding protein [Candidatus Cloacimonetes bacterium]|nr:(Fe-S)-binding protein [Candidatus Cloacimonadota bacterium]
MQKVAQDTVKILMKNKTSFGILGKDENCCGEGIRRVGAEKVFQKVSKANITTFKKAGVKNILVSSPHCFTVFKNDYPTLDAKFKVLHTTQYFSQLIDAKIIKPNKSFAKKVVYHDPCTLGRQNNIYEEPRYILKNIPDLELVEVKDFNRDFSLCCGAGCGGLWLEWEKKERIVNVRIQQLMETGAEIIAVACPYCLQMFEETIKTMDLDVQVMDVSEILWESLQ